ncbi:hypothetical protein K439DRAFT_199622 [Ramaria rubella]|nr:hypothetical protein K439DRAFT_199622 [Ramaria rubella]
MSIDNLEYRQPQGEAFYKFSIYPFDSDPVFQVWGFVQNASNRFTCFIIQEGLRSIVSSAHGKSPEELENIIGQAKVFYFSRTTGQELIWENYVEWKNSRPSPFPDTPAVLPGEEAASIALQIEQRTISAPLSFQQITDLIKTGQTHLIPNNRVVPEALHTEAPSESRTAARRKPWEKEEEPLISDENQTRSQS